jgi:hypothetical protein
MGFSHHLGLKLRALFDCADASVGQVRELLDNLT